MTPALITGAILAGGESRRMGTNKALAIYKNKPLIQWVYDAMVPVCSEILVIANSGDFSFLNARVVNDNFPGTGPAAGLEAALAAASNTLVLVASCDTPNLSADFFMYLIDNHDDNDISITGHDQTDEPLIGVYHQRIHPVFLESLNQGNNRPPAIIRQTRWQTIQVHSGLDFYRNDLFLNLNSPQDLIKP
jgi:molybdopterin-guanine dinucleotide biosynthesis protein A